MSNGSYIEYLYRNPPPGWKLEHPSTYHYFSFEAIDTRWWLQFGMSHWYYSIYASVSYVIAIFAIQWYMKDRPAFQLKTPLFLWNLCLGLYSIIGFCRYFPAFVSIFSKPNGFYNSICARSDLTIPFSYWTILFVGSKMVELGDTFFILLKKKKLMFLQWFHHLATMITTWILGKNLLEKENFNEFINFIFKNLVLFLVPYMEPVLRWYAFLNYGVHSLMYPYFALKVKCD